MEVREERQQSAVAEDVSALVAVTRPIIAGLLHSIGEEFLTAHGGRENLRLGDWDGFARPTTAISASHSNTPSTTRS
jgi:hypothetical protein